jgi:hypothetical protein
MNFFFLFKKRRPLLVRPRPVRSGRYPSRMEVFLAVVAVVGSLGGVLLGSMLNTRIARHEREAACRDALINDASAVLGSARVTLTATSPDSYVFSAGPQASEAIAKRRVEADSVRPSLAALAVRWPDASPELNLLERHLGTTPTSLSILVDAVLTHAPDLKATLAEAQTRHDLATAALDTAIRKLHNTGGPT